MNSTEDFSVNVTDISLLRLVERIWYSLDDILVSLGIFLVSGQVSIFIHFCLRYYFQTSAYVSQAAHFMFQFTVFVFLLSHLVGMSTADSLFGGFSIGIGYAMQPYIVSLVAGATLLLSRMIQSGDQLTIRGETVQVDHVGLLYVAAKQDKSFTYFPNAMLAQSSFTVTRS